jgi:hypothetical protein
VRGLAHQSTSDVIQRRPRFRPRCPAAILSSRLGSSSPRIAPTKRGDRQRLK